MCNAMNVSLLKVGDAITTQCGQPQSCYVVCPLQQGSPLVSGSGLVNFWQIEVMASSAFGKL